MTLKSVVLPAPFGPMMPRRSPRRTSRLTSRTAVRPPKRFVTRSSVSTGPPGPQATGDTGQALGGEPHDEDEGRAVDDEIDAGEPGLQTRERRAQVRLERRDQDRAEEGAQGGAHPPDDRVQREPDREVDREDIEGVDEADVLRPERAADRRHRGAERHRADLQSAARDAERLGGVLVLADAGELVADPRGLEPDLHAVVDQRDDEGHVDPRDVAEAERPEAGTEGDRDPLRARREAAPAARDDQEHLRERDRGEREVGAAEAIREIADHPAGGDREDHPEEEPEPGALIEARRHQGRGVGTDAEEGGVAEGDLAGVAPRHVPGGRERSPHEDQDQAVEDERVAHDQRQEGGDAEERERGPAPGRQRGHHTPSVSAPRWPKSPAGRKTSTAMNRTK